MKNKRRFLASVALGIFLTATIAPVVISGEELGIDKRQITKTGSKKK
jgi:hypothetical protein